MVMPEVLRDQTHNCFATSKGGLEEQGFALSNLLREEMKIEIEVTAKKEREPSA
jgi:enamine deaminase RidA (YjgF/YER057c/UK114 family)